ncbi:hypothetical protein [Qipengyuania sp.]|uniref:hypothetical protein n=1 Tax=Qipengyuania sp. TaxID=2004515 RepID=UPI0037358DD9
MSGRAVAILGGAALAACSQGNAGEQESADAFAARISGDAGPGKALRDPSQSVQGRAKGSERATLGQARIAPLQQLGDISGVDLGPRDGGCTFVDGEHAMLTAAAMRDKGVPGKGIIRTGNRLTVLDSGPGGLDRLRGGSTFSGEGLTAVVQPAGKGGATRSATLTIANVAGARQTYSGNWICA